MVEVKKGRREIDTEIYLRLAKYTDPCPALEEMKTWIANSWTGRDGTKKTGKIVSDIDLSEGWVPVEHIERSPCPYKQPKAHRYIFLNDDELGVIERKSLKYHSLKPGKVSPQIYSKTMYRLARSKVARAKLRKFFGANPLFLFSEYMISTLDAGDVEQERLLSALRVVYDAVGHKIDKGNYPTTTQYFDALDVAMSVLREEFKKGRHSSRSHSQKELDESADEGVISLLKLRGLSEEKAREHMKVSRREHSERQRRKRELSG